MAGLPWGKGANVPISWGDPAAAQLPLAAAIAFWLLLCPWQTVQDWVLRVQCKHPPATTYRKQSPVSFPTVWERAWFILVGQLRSGLGSCVVLCVDLELLLSLLPLPLAFLFSLSLPVHFQILVCCYT